MGGGEVGGGGAVRGEGNRKSLKKQLKTHGAKSFIQQVHACVTYPYMATCGK